MERKLEGLFDDFRHLLVLNDMSNYRHYSTITDPRAVKELLRHEIACIQEAKSDWLKELVKLNERAAIIKLRFKKLFSKEDAKKTQIRWDALAESVKQADVYMRAAEVEITRLPMPTPGRTRVLMDPSRITAEAYDARGAEFLKRMMGEFEKPEPEEPKLEKNFLKDLRNA